MVTRGRAFSFLFPVLCSIICGLVVLRIGTCMAEESPPLAELRAEAKEERERELVYLAEETVSIATLP
jgi:hypothetical protein